jgi:hypothetical protein
MFSLEPFSDANLIRSSHTLTARVSLDSLPIQGADVSFEVIEGPHQGTSVTKFTDDNGEATFTYTKTALGVDTIIASVDIDGDGEVDAAKQATKEWEGESPNGACCLPDGSCIEGTEGECATAGGIYQGDETDCASACKDEGGKTICSTLGNDPKPYHLDQDIFRFYGTKGETVTIRLEADPPEFGSGKRATLILRNKTGAPQLFRRHRTALPHEITATLPISGNYTVIVAEQPKNAWARILWGERYNGDYCITLEASPDTCQTLEPALYVE